MNANIYRCVVIDDDKSARTLLGRFIEMTASLTLEASFGDSVEGQQFLLENPTIDILFLDIEMPDMSGIELLKTLPDLPETILTTSHTGFALDAFELDVTDYVIKPVEYGRFSQAVIKATKKLDLIQTKEAFYAQNPEDLYVKVNNRMVKVRLDDILYIEALSDYVLIHTISDKLVVYSTLKAIGTKLKGERFMRIHRSYIINLRQIDAIEDNSVITHDKNIPISKSYRNEFFTRINRL